MPASIFPTRLAAAGATLFLGATLVGCVNKDDYTALKMDRDNLAELLADAERDAASSKSMAEGYRNQLDRVASAGDADKAKDATYEMQIAALTGERDDLARRYEDLINKIGTGPALPEALTSELSVFAAQNPDLVAFDADRGIVKFKSDVTFTSGDATLKPEANAAIERFAQILNGNVARSFELRVAGHTDNVGNFSAVTKGKGHKDNWYLSSHRAISVAEKLMAQGVSKSRVGVLGFADQRPVASNDSAPGRAANRRVEVLILPETVQDLPVAEAPGAPEAIPAAGKDDAVSTYADDSNVMK